MMNGNRRLQQDLCHDLQRRAWDEAQADRGRHGHIAGLVAEATRIRSKERRICGSCVFFRDCERMSRRGCALARARRDTNAA